MIKRENNLAAGFINGMILQTPFYLVVGYLVWRYWA